MFPKVPQADQGSGKSQEVEISQPNEAKSNKTVQRNLKSVISQLVDSEQSVPIVWSYCQDSDTNDQSRKEVMKLETAIRSERSKTARPLILRSSLSVQHNHARADCGVGSMACAFLAGTTPEPYSAA